MIVSFSFFADLIKISKISDLEQIKVKNIFNMKNIFILIK